MQPVYSAEWRIKERRSLSYRNLAPFPWKGKGAGGWVSEVLVLNRGENENINLAEERMNPEGRLRVLIAKPGLDGHDRGAKIIARGYRDAGFEVVYIGLHQAPEQIVNAAIQEDVDLVGLSCLSGAHLYLFSEVVKQLREKGAGDITVIGGGIIPKEDIPKLKEAGIREVFLPGTSLEEVIKWTKENVKPLNRLGKYRGEDEAGK